MVDRIVDDNRLQIQHKMVAITIHSYYRRPNHPSIPIEDLAGGDYIFERCLLDLERLGYVAYNENGELIPGRLYPPNDYWM